METLFIRLEEWLNKYFILWPIDYDENINVFMRFRLYHLWHSKNN